MSKTLAHELAKIMTKEGCEKFKLFLLIVVIAGVLALVPLVSVASNSSETKTTTWNLLSESVIFRHEDATAPDAPDLEDCWPRVSFYGDADQIPTICLDEQLLRELTIIAEDESLMDESSSTTTRFF